MKLSWKWLEGAGYVLVAVAAVEAPRFAVAYPDMHWIAGAAAGVAALVAFLRMSPSTAAALAAAQNRVDTLTSQLGGKL